MSDDQTARLALPYLAAGQMQKHVTLNESLTRLDALIQTAVVSRTTTAQPGEPDDGALWILPPGATGADWSTRPAGALMRAEGGGWTVVAVVDGLIALVLDAGELLVWQGGAWVDLGARLGVAQGLTRLGIGTTADGANPFTARLNAALWTALEAASGGSGDLRLTLNKETSGDVLSLLFQSGYGGRAELGLVGDDDLRLKVSGDGGSWHEVFAVDRATGRATFERGAGRRAVTILTSDGSYAVPAWARSIEAVLVGAGGGGGGGDSGASSSRFGGGGGGAGGISRGKWPTDLLGATLTVAVGSGGVGGAAAAGSAGGDSTLHRGGTALLVAAGGGGGLDGTAGGGAGVAGAGSPDSNAGGGSSVTAAGAPGRSFDRPDAPGGGGAGGGLDGTGVAYAGGAGGDGGSLAVKAPGGSGGTGSAGSPGDPASEPSLHWAGGGGGGGGAATSGTGHDGADGGSAGGGGGGGGAGISVGGTGGVGGAGVVWLVAVG